MKPSRPLLISKIQQVISRILAELERLFHNLHCLDDNGLAGTSELSVAKLRFRRCRCFLFRIAYLAFFYSAFS